MRVNITSCVLIEQIVKLAFDRDFVCLKSEILPRERTIENKKYKFTSCFCFIAVANILSLTGMFEINASILIQFFTFIIVVRLCNHYIV